MNKDIEKLLGEEIIIKNGKKELTQAGAFILTIVTIELAHKTIDYVLNNFQKELEELINNKNSTNL